MYVHQLLRSYLIHHADAEALGLIQSTNAEIGLQLVDIEMKAEGVFLRFVEKEEMDSR